MITIHKQAIEITDVQSIELPARSVFLSVQMQFGTPCIWYECDDSYPKERRTIAIVGTGHDAKHCVGFRFLGTIQIDGGALVFHVFGEW